MNILFLCTGNSCRSVLSEGVFNHLAPAGWRAISAGSRPAFELAYRIIRTRVEALLACLSVA